MGALLDNKGLNRKPNNVAPNCWYYEEPGGLAVYFNGQLVGVLPWRSVAASLRRKQVARSKTAMQRTSLRSASRSR